MNSSGIRMAFCLLVVLGVVSCGGVPVEDGSQAVKLSRLTRVTTDEPVYHDWKRIYSVELTGTQRVRTHVGFLDHRFTDADRGDPQKGGTFVVKDRKHAIRGYLLPLGRAFMYEPSAEAAGKDPVASDLGNMGFDNGVKKILDVPGAIEYDVVSEASVAPPKE